MRIFDKISTHIAKCVLKLMKKNNYNMKYVITNTHIIFQTRFVISIEMCTDISKWQTNHLQNALLFLLL